MTEKNLIVQGLKVILQKRPIGMPKETDFQISKFQVRNPK